MDRKSKPFPRAQSLPLIQQKIALTRRYPCSTCRLVRNVLTWKAKISPTSLSRTYDATLIYNGYPPPKVYISGESLRKLDAPSFPHRYEIDVARNRVRICLYYRDGLDYSKPFSETLVPWIAEWLFHYEIWLATGQWSGGGLHPPGGKKTSAKQSTHSLSSTM